MGVLFALKYTMSSCPFPFIETNFLNVTYLKPAIKMEQPVPCAVLLFGLSLAQLAGSVLATKNGNPGLKFTEFAMLQKLLSAKCILAFIDSE